MNNKGQSLVMFVLILPLIVMFLALLINSGVSYYNKTKIKGSIESNLEIILKKDIKDINRIKEVMVKNLPNEEIDIKIMDNKINLVVKTKDNYLFSKFMPSDNKKEYNYCGNYDTDAFYLGEGCIWKKRD